jgi:hypothetical protein
MSLRKFAFTIILAILMSMSASFSYAQTTSGAIVGVVRDASGMSTEMTTTASLRS